MIQPVVELSVKTPFSRGGGVCVSRQCAGGPAGKPPSDNHLPPAEVEQARHRLGISDKGMADYAQRVMENMNFVEAMI